MTAAGPCMTMPSSKLAAAQLRHRLSVKVVIKNREPRSVRLRASQECLPAFKARKVVLIPPDSECADRDSCLRSAQCQRSRVDLLRQPGFHSTLTRLASSADEARNVPHEITTNLAPIRLHQLRAKSHAAGGDTIHSVDGNLHAPRDFALREAAGKHSPDLIVIDRRGGNVGDHEF